MRSLKGSKYCGVLKKAGRGRTILFAILANIIILTFSFQLVSSQATIYSAQSGDWSSVATWMGGVIPGPADSVVIQSGHTVSLATTAGESMVSLVVEPGAVFDARNKVVIISGRLIVDGNYTSDNIAAKDLSFSGDTMGGTGTIAINDPACALNLSSDVVIPSSTHLNLLGNIYIGDGATVTNQGFLTVTGNIEGEDASGSAWINDTNAVLEIGDTLMVVGNLIASAMGNTITYIRQGPQAIKTPDASTYYNLVISGTGIKTIIDRLVIGHDLSILSGTLDGSNDSIEIQGDWSNQATFLSGSETVIFNGSSDQTIHHQSGEQFHNLTVDKPGGGLILEADVTVGNMLTMDAGIIHALDGLLTVGTGLATPGSVNYNGGHINGYFERWINAAGTYSFPVGSDDRPQFIYITINGLQTGGTLVMGFNKEDPGNQGLPVFDDPDSVHNAFVDGFWDMEEANGFNLGGANDYSISLDGTGFTAFPITPSTRVLIRQDASGDWGVEGNHQIPLGSTARRTGLTTLPGQFAFGDITSCSRPVTSVITGAIEVCTGSAGISYSVTDHPPNTYSWIVTGGTQASGGNSNSITVDWGSVGMEEANVRVMESNACTQGSPVDLPVTVHSIQPPSITGRSSIAANTVGVPYSVSGIAGYTYTWTITGGTQASGGNTASITVDWGSSGTGLVSVVAQMPGCSVAPATELEVNIYVIIESVQTGNWTDPTTWDCNCIPLSTENVRINPTHTVKLITGGNGTEVNNFIIEAGGTLDANDKAMTIHGDLEINGTHQGGTKTLEMDGFGKFIDGIGSITEGITLSSNIYFTTTAVVSITSAELVIGPGVTVSNYGTVTVASDVSGSDALSQWTNRANSTLRIGGVLLTTGVLETSSAGNTVIYNGTGDQPVKVPLTSYANLVAEGSGIKSLAGNISVEERIALGGTSTLDVTAAGYAINLAGNWHNLGGAFDEQSGEVILDGIGDQYIFGSETFYDLQVNSGGNLIFDSDLSVSNHLSMNGGDIDPQLNTLMLGTGIGSPGSLTHVSGTVLGRMTRWITTTGTPCLFPVGSIDHYRPASLTFTDLTQGSLTVEFVEIDPGSAGLPLNEGTVSITEQFPEGYWNFLPQNGLATNDYNIRLTATDFMSHPIIPGTRIIKRTNGGNWFLDGSHSPAMAPDLFRDNLTGGISVLGTQFCIGHIVCIGLSIDRIITDVSCFGGNDGAIDVTVNGGTAPYDFSWGHGPTTEDVNTLAAGIYTLNVSDGEGCEADSLFTVAEPAILCAMVDSTQVTCVGGSDGMIMLSAPSGGSGSYEYTIDGGSSWQSSGNFTGLTAGIYDVWIRDASATACVIVLDPSLELSEPNDFIPPLAVCQDITIQLDATGNASITGADLDGGSTDNCGIASLLASPNAFTCANVGPNTVILTVRDVNGNENSCAATVTIEDNTAPVALCKDITVPLNASGVVNITGTDVDNGSYDACGIQSKTVSPNTFSCSDVGPNNVTLMVTDVNGLVSTCDAIVTVEDNTVPVALCRDITIQLDGTGNALITGADIDNGSYDACGIQSLSASPNNFDCSDVGPNVVTLMVTDVNGLVNTCTATVTVENNITPITLCRDFSVQLDATGHASITAADIDDGSVASCGILSMTVFPNTFTCSDVGMVPVTLVVTDIHGNADSCTAIVEVEDNVVPVALCRDITVQLDASGITMITGEDIDNGSYDVCGIQSLDASPHIFTIADIGPNDVTLFVTDKHGHVNTCNAVVTVQDNVPPDVYCQDITVQLDESGYVSISAADIDIGSDDAGGIQYMSVAPDAFTCNDIGPNTVTLTVTDNNGNSDSCTATVTVEDTIAPFISCPGNISEPADAGENFTIPDYTALATVSDNCSSDPVITQDPMAGTMISGVGTNQAIILFAEDEYGNASQCDFNITLVEGSLPRITCPGDQIEYADDQCQFILPDYSGMAVVSEADTVIQIPAPGTAIRGASTVQIIRLVARNSTGDSASCHFNVMLSDPVPPVVICPNDTVVYTPAGSCSTVVTDIASLAGTDNCGVQEISYTLTGSTTGSGMYDASGTTFNPGLTTVWYRITDNSGNMDSCSFNITVVADLAVPDSAYADRNNICPGEGMVTLSYAGGDPGSEALASWYADSSLLMSIGSGNNLNIAAPVVSTPYFVRFEGNCDTSAVAGFLLRVVTTSEAPDAAVADKETVCAGQGTITLSYLGGSPGSEIIAQWYADDQFMNPVGAGNNIEVPAPMSTTDYYVRFESACDTSGSVSTTVHVLPSPIPFFVETDDQVCTTGALSRYVVSGQPGSTFSWNLTGGTVVSDYGDTVLVDWGNTSGTYQIGVIETNASGCSSDPLTATVIASSPVVDLGEDRNLCEGSSLEIIPQGYFSHHMWNDGSTGSSYLADTTELVKIQVFDEAGCTASDSVQVIMYPLPVVDLGNDTVLCGNRSIVLDAGNPGATYLWSTGEVTREIEVFAGAGDIAVEVTYGGDCIGTDEISVLPCTGGEVLGDIPNLFTPNGDGVNDTWFFYESAAFPEMVVEIYDRWGKRVYISEPGYPVPWDGRSMHGVDMPMDSYHYIIKPGDGFDDVVGTITIVR
jgi:gliding motility-associated-like protein